MGRVTRALVPAAGRGTRMLPLTTAIPKEMLPLGRKPVLEYVVEELTGAGIRDVLIVVNGDKPLIRNYFGNGGTWGINIAYALQPEMKGLGDAVLCGLEWAGSDPFVVAFGDCIIESDSHDALSRLIRLHEDSAAFAAVLAQEVAENSVSRYGILEPREPIYTTAETPFSLKGIVEKPHPESAPSRWAVAARWILSPRIFPWIGRTEPDSMGEVGLSQAVDGALKNGESGWAVPLLKGEHRVDIGSWDSYLTASARAALNDPEFGVEVRRQFSAEEKLEVEENNN